MLKLTRPTVSRLYRTLLELGYLDHDARIDRYFIGPAAVALGHLYIVNTPLRMLAAKPAPEQRAVLAALAKERPGSKPVRQAQL